MQRIAKLVALIVVATAGSTIAPAQSQPRAADALPAFEVATIKPSDRSKGGAVGFLSYPGGRVHLGYTSVQMFLYFAYGVQSFQIAGGPPWITTDLYDIEAVPPESSPSRAQKQAPFKIAPTEEQRQMMQRLLADRFKLQIHREMRDGPVYILSRGGGKLELEDPKDKDMDWRGAIMDKGGIYDGETFGANISMANLAAQLSRNLGMTVLDQTGLLGTYDFHLPPDDPQNTDKEAAVFDAMHRLGLNLKKGKGPVETLVIDHIERPTEN